MSSLSALPSAELGARYLRLVRWLLADSSWRFRSAAIAILAAGTASVFVQVWVLGALVYYARYLEDDRLLRAFGLEVQARHSMALLVIVALGVLGGAVLAAVLAYFAQSRTIHLGRRYEDFCSRRALRLLGSNVAPWARSSGFSEESTQLRLVRSDSRYCGRALMILLGGFRPALTGVIGAAILARVDPLATGAAFLLLLISGLFYYRVSVVGARHSKAMEELSAPAGFAVRGVLKETATRSYYGPARLEWEDDLYRGNGMMKRYLDAYEGRLVAVSRGQLVGQVTFSAVAFVVLLSLGGSSLFRQTDWGLLLAYVLALRWTFASVNDVTRRLTAINRFYPQLRRYSGFLRAVEPGRVPSVALRELEIQVSKEVSALPGSLRQWRCSTGARLALVTPLPVRRPSCAWFLEALFADQTKARGALDRARFVLSEVDRPSMPLGPAFGLPEEGAAEAFASALSGLRLPATPSELFPSGLSKVYDEDEWRSLTPPARVLLAVAGCLATDCDWVVIESAELLLLDPPLRKSVLRLFGRRCLLVRVAPQALHTVGECHEMIAVVLGAQGVLGIGSPAWLKSLESPLPDLSAAPQASADSEFVEDDLEDL